MRLAAIGLVALVAAVAAGSAGASFPAAKGRLVLVAENAGGGAAAPALRRDDGSLTQVGIPVGIHGSATLSADGTQVALVSTIDFFPDLTTPTLIVGDLLGGFEDLSVGRVKGRAAWSPDGSRLAYAGDAGGGNWDIYVTGASAGAAPVDLTPGSPAADLEPRWSPDGTKIAFESARSGNFDVYTMGTDGSAVTDLTGDPAADTLGDWSPDSQRLVFTSTRSGGGDLYVVGRNGGAATQLTSGPGAETHAAWSPNGATIAYSSDVDGDNDVYSVATDGTGEKRLTDNAAEDIVQDWQPLIDSTSPTVRALPGSSRRGLRATFRFRVAEGANSAAIDLFFRYHTPHGLSEVETGRTVTGTRGGRIVRVSLPAEAVRSAPRAFTFCVTATDPSQNVGKASCALYRLLPKAKPKKKRR